jgi:tRNA (Thr-GGU) A37 N-methylase
VTIVAIDDLRIRVRDLEALDGTPVLDVKPVRDVKPVLDPGVER